MKLPVILWLVLLPVAHAQTRRLNWKLTDFQPLTSLPWHDFAPQEVPKIVERIFREPNADIRYPVLAEYLRQAPLVHFGLAFDVAVMLEGTQTPNKLVALMLGIWAERDPLAAWERTQSLVGLVGLEEGWLHYDSWNGRMPILVQDLEAIRKSRFWLHRSALLAFPVGIEASKLPQNERVRLMKAFAGLWFEKFKCWPADRRSDAGLYDAPLSDWELLEMFNRPPDYLRHSDVSQSGRVGEAAFEIGVRRWLQSRVQDGPEIIERIMGKHWPADRFSLTPEHDAAISPDFLLLWSQIDLLSLSTWADSAPPAAHDAAWLAKCLMMPHVGAAMRERWIARIQADERKDRMSALAPWLPQLAMQWAVDTQNADVVRDVGDACVYGGPWSGTTWNTTHAGLGFIQSFDLLKLPQALRSDVSQEWGIAIMEQWGNVDAGEAARYGFRFLQAQDWPPQEDLIHFFSGRDEFPDEGGMIDRTFCALRVWAVVRPDEMRSWISAQKSLEIRRALTWLLEHPWGNPPKE